MKIPANIPLYIFLISIGFFGFLFSIFIQQNISANIFLIFVGVGGLILSSYILYIKLCDKPLICPTGSNCNEVIHSEYSKFFGIPLEYLGIFYYSFIAAIYTVLVVSPGIVPQWLVFGTLALTSVGFLFSIYLTLVQAFVLRQWCMWCLLSAVFSTTIFIVSLGKLAVGTAFLLKIYPWLLTTHLLAFALGVGTVTVIAVLFFKFLKDFRISASELGVIKTVFQIIWFSLAVLVLTEVALYLPRAETLISSPQFLVGIFTIMVIAILGVIMNLIILPIVTAIAFDEKKTKEHSEFIRMRKITFGLGAIFITSWYFAFFLEVFPQLPFKYSSLITAYAMILITSIVLSQLIEKKISSHTKRRS